MEVSSQLWLLLGYGHLFVEIINHHLVMILMILLTYLDFAKLWPMNGEGQIMLIPMPCFVAHFLASKLTIPWRNFLSYVVLFHSIIAIYFSFTVPLPSLEAVYNLLVSWSMASFMPSSWTLRTIISSCSWNFVLHLQKDKNKSNVAFACHMRC